MTETQSGAGAPTQPQARTTSPRVANEGVRAHIDRVARDAQAQADQLVQETRQRVAAIHAPAATPDHAAAPPTPPPPAPVSGEQLPPPAPVRHVSQTEPPPPTPAPVKQESKKPAEPLPRELTAGMVAAQHKIEHTNQQSGKRVESMQVIQERNRETGAMLISADRTKWEGRYKGLRGLSERIWKTSFGRINNKNKEESHGGKLNAEAGLQMVGMDAIFFNKVDLAARARVEQQRQGFFSKASGGIRDALSELTFREKDLHRARLGIVRELRDAAENPAQANQVDAGLFAEYKSLLTGDFTEAEALAAKVSSEAGDQLLRTTIGEKMGASAVILDGSFGDYIKNNVMKPIITEGLVSGTVSEETLMQARMKMQEAFFQPDFVQWYDAQPQDVRDGFNLSLSYGSDIVPLVHEVMLPQVLEAEDHRISIENLDDYLKEFVLKVQVGTLKAGQEGTMEKSFIEKAGERSIKNKDVLDIYQRLRSAGTAPNLVPDTYLNASVRRADVLGRVLRVGTNPALIGAATGIAIAAGSGFTRLNAVVGGVLGSAGVAGVLEGYGEWKKTGQERKQHNIERAIGYTFSTEMKRREEMKKYEYNMRGMQTDLVDPMQLLLTKAQENNNTLSVDQCMVLMSYVADTDARFNIMENRGIDLLMSNNSQSYQVEKTNLELTKFRAMAKLREILTNDPAKADAIKTQLNIAVPAGADALDFITQQLTGDQVTHIEKGTGQNVDYQVAMGHLTVDKAESIKARDRAFVKYRMWKTTKAFARGAAPGVIFVGSNTLINMGANYVVENDLLGLGNVAENMGYATRGPEPTIGGVTLKDWYDIPQDINLGNGVEIRMDPTIVDGGKIVRLHDAVTGDVIPGPSVWLQRGADGSTSIITAGRPDQLPAGFSNLFGNWDHHTTSLHNMLEHTQSIAQNGVDKIPDEVIGGANDYKGNFLLNTHDVHQVLNDKGQAYDAWAAATGRKDPLTGVMEVGKMSITGSDGTMINGFANPDGSYTMNLQHYGNTDLLSNPGKLLSMEAGLEMEGWDVTRTGDVLHVVPPTATEYTMPIDREFTGTNFGIPWFIGRRELERPEAVRGETPPRIPRKPEVPPVPTEPNPYLEYPNEYPMEDLTMYGYGEKSMGYGYGQEDMQDTDILENSNAVLERGDIEEEVKQQQMYIDKIQNRYTVANLEKNLVIARQKKTQDGEDVDDTTYNKSVREAKRLQIFLNSLNKEPRDYLTELEEVNGALLPMGENARFSIVIPAYSEGKNIQQTLRSWTEQIDLSGNAIDPSQIEILVLINRPNETKQFDQTDLEIEKFKQANPQFASSMQYVQKTFNFPNKKVKAVDGTEKEVPDVHMGTIYRYATDLAMLRNLNRNGKSHERIANHVIRTGGADVVARSPYHVARIIDSFEKNVPQEQYVSLSDYHPDVYKKIPLLFMTKKLQDQMNEQLTKGLSNIGLGTYRASLYARAGGFEPRVKIAEEMELSRRMRKVLRESHEDLRKARKRDLIINALDDPRRDIVTLFAGKTITEAYSDYNTNLTVRDTNIKEILEKDIPPVVELTPQNLSKQANAILKLYIEQFFDPSRQQLEPHATLAAIKALQGSLASLGIKQEDIHISFSGQPFDEDLLKKSSLPINEIKDRVSLEITSVPSVDEISRLLEEEYKKYHGEWIEDKYGDLYK